MSIRALAERAGNLAFQPPRTGLGHLRNHGPRDRRAIALTFDDGPGQPSTAQLLDVLGAADVQATFFCMGVMVEWSPDLVARQHAEGHVVANHSYDHTRSPAFRPGNGDHIDQASDAIEGVIGRRPALYRPPWGWLTPIEQRRLKQRSMAAIGWDVYPDDWMFPEVPAPTLVDQVLGAVQPGSIVLFHDARSHHAHHEKTETSHAVATLIPLLRSEGYELVTVPELLGIPAYRYDAADRDPAR